MSSPVQFHTVFFDLDNTLYQKSSGISDAVTARIQDYMVQYMKFTPEQAEQQRYVYYKEYGLTLKGLMFHHEVDPSHYLDFVHGGLELSKHLQPDPELRAMLSKMSRSVKKWVFSNADLPHCERVIKMLDIDGIFDGILDYLQLLDNCKPHPISYEIAITLAESKNYDGCIMLDDSLENLIGAKQKGMTTVLVGSVVSHVDVDYCIENVRDFVKIFPELFAE